MSTLTTIRYERRGPVAEIVLDRPEANNSMTPEFFDELMAVTTSLATENGLRVVVLRANGKTFSYGANVDMFVGAGENRPRLVRELVSKLNVSITALARLEVPVVAIVHGMTIGGGLGLVACCDIVLAGVSTRFRTGWTGLGLSADAGATMFLPRLIGMRRTLDLLLTNRIFTAAEAEAWGLVTEIVEDDRLAERARELVEALAAGPTLAFGACKRLLHEGADAPLETHLENEGATITRIAASRDVDEGCRAFAEGRRPIFEGR